jgi:quercetin dioxygenase-like cupin family protein
MKRVCYPDVEGLDSLALGLEGSEKMKVKLISQDTVCLEIAPGGCTPDHHHQDKERIVVMEGTGEVTTEERSFAIHPGDFVEFEEDEQHQIRNDTSEDLIFMVFRNQR